MRKYLIANVNAGNGPYLRAVEFLYELNKTQKNKWGIVLPHLYGEKQKRILKEEFGHLLGIDKELVLLDEGYGQILSEALFTGSDYRKYLESLTADEDLQIKINEHFAQEIATSTLEGTKVTLSNEQLKVEYARNSIVKLPINKAIYTSIFYTSTLLQTAVDNGIMVDRETLQQAIEYFKKIEKRYDVRAMCEPSTFSGYPQIMKAQLETSILCPPLMGERAVKETIDEEGTYVVISGIPEIRYDDLKIPGKVYSSSTKRMPASEVALPGIINDPKITCVVARSGWGAVWNALLQEKPLLLMPYMQGDDPEIYFNNQTLEKLGLAKIIDLEADFEEEREVAQGLVKNQVAMKKRLVEKYGTTNGFEYLAGQLQDYFQDL